MSLMAARPRDRFPTRAWSILLWPGLDDISRSGVACAAPYQNVIAIAPMRVLISHLTFVSWTGCIRVLDINRFRGLRVGVRGMSEVEGEPVAGIADYRPPLGRA